MYRYPAQEPVYPSHSGTRRKPHAFEPINPFTPRRQRTLPVDSVRDVDEIPLPPQRHLYHQQAGQSPNARPEFTSHSTTHRPNILHSAPARVHYAIPSEYRAPQPSHGTPSRPLGIPSEVLNRYPPPQVIAYSRPPSSLSEVQSRPPSSQSEVQSRPHSSQSQVPNSSPPPSTHSEVLSRPPTSQTQVPNLSRPPSTHSEHSSPTPPPIPGQDSGQQPSEVTRTAAWEAITSPPPHSSAQLPVIRPNVAPMSSQNHLLLHGLQNQSTNGSPSALPSSSLESFEKDSSIATPSSTESGSSHHYLYHEPIGWVGGSLAQTPVETSFNKEPPLRLDPFLFIDLLRDIYYLFLLNVPRLYYSRVGRVLKEAQLSIEEMMEMSLVTSPAYKRFQEDIMETGFFSPSVRYSTPAYERLRAAWELFIDGLLQDWKALNVMTVLLLSAIVSIFQIDSAAADPVTRYTAFASLICALMSLMYSCVFLTQFASMRQPYKAVEWAVEAQKRQASLWNVWIMLATPVVWLSWSLIAFISSIMSFMWRVGIKFSDREISTTPKIELVCRVLLSVLFCLGIVYGVLIINTLRRYGSQMDEAWERRINGFISRTLPSNSQERSSPPAPAPYYPPPPPFTSYANPAMGVPWTPAVPVIPMSPSTTTGQSFKESPQSSDALGDPNHSHRAGADTVADSTGAKWHPPLPLLHSSTVGSGKIHPLLLAPRYGTHRWSNSPDTRIKQPPGNREKTDTSQFAFIPPHAVPGSAPPPAREGVEVAMAIRPPVDDLTTTRPVSGSSDESHHQTFNSGKEKGRSRSPVPDHLHSPPVSVNDTSRASSDYIRGELSTSHTSSAPEQRRKVNQTPVELSSTSVPDLPPGPSRHTSSPSSPIFVPLYENTLGLFMSAANGSPSPGPSSLPPTSSSSKETQ